MSRSHLLIRIGFALVVLGRLSNQDAERLMQKRKVRRLPVVNDNAELVGLISLNDISRESKRQLGKKHADVTSEAVASTLAELCEPRTHREQAVEN